ncbi:hypothetical protein CDAR_247241 [Caerostris darwini]|uniref:Uncharacterized protein n=1 Tax=Caerostris darwini TaxID=1538125 RepID=A0AAV4X405_9ARAC|nr:hypothetical protein CDAR_247241 [Caerostris darwini]
MKLLQPKKTLGQMTSPTGSLSRPIFQTVNLSRFFILRPLAPLLPSEETCWILLALVVSIPFPPLLKKPAGFRQLEGGGMQALQVSSEED